MDWFRRYWLKLLLLVGSSLLASGVFVASIWAGDHEVKNHEKYLWIGAVLAVAVVLVAASETALNEREKEHARREAGRLAGALALSYHSTLAPLATALGKLAEEHAEAYAATGAPVPAGLAGARAAESAVILRSVLVGASVLTTEPDPGTHLPTARCAFYRLTDRGRHEFTLVDWAGAPPGPRPVIDGAAGSHFLHDILDNGAQYHVGQVTGLVSKVDQFSAKYRSVIAVPVVAGGKKIGVLAVDAPGGTDLTVVHVDLMKSLAGLLGATLALAG
ncbi:GAF domain-containing protein [Kitasatospora indigofera]|uniref:GAF domain-containing protein n=1 Tax=Kitasatospora indigofera TaxID=67307 RepID=UPI00365B9FAA